MRRSLRHVLAGAILGCASADSRPPADEPFVAELSRLRPSRTFAQRLSIQTGVGTRSTGLAARATSIATRAEARGRAGDPDALHAMALVDLLWATGAGRSLDRSISYLVIASELAPHRASILADLSAAYSRRAEIRRDPRDYFESLDAAERALDLDSTNAAAAFNAELALDRLGLIERPGSQAPVDTIEDMWDHVLPDWGRAVQIGDSGRAHPLLSVARRVSQDVARNHDDNMLRDAMLEIDAASGGGRIELARTYDLYGEAKSRYVTGDYSAARRLFEALLRERAPRELRLRATAFHAATLVYTGGDPHTAQRTLERLVADNPMSGRASLVARAHWMLGTINLRAGAFDAARHHYSLAADGYARTGESESLGAVEGLNAEAMATLHDPGAYSTATRALAALRDYPRSVWTHNLLIVIAHTATADGLLRAAHRVLDEAVRRARETGRPFDDAESRIARAQLVTTSRDAASASRDIIAVRAALPSLDGPRRAFLDAQIRLAIATNPHTPARLATDTLAAATKYFNDQRNQIWLLQSLIVSANAALSENDLETARVQLDRVIDLFVRERDSVRAAPLRVALTEGAKRAFDDMAVLWIDAGDPLKARGYVELGRVSLSPVSVRPARKDPPGYTDPSTGVIEYAILRDTLRIWTVSGSVVTYLNTSVTATDLQSAIVRARAALQFDAAPNDTRIRLDELSDKLVRPVESFIERHRDIAIVADGQLASVPFAAIPDRKGQALVRNHVIRFSATVAEAQATTRRITSSAPAVLVSNPSFNRDSFPSFTPLPAAAAEVDQISPMYHASVLLSNDRATSSALHHVLARASMLHFAGHAVYDDEHPEQSYLLMADGRLDAATIARWDLADVDLVVLAACEAERSRPARAGGFSGLSGAFAAAGVRSVIAALWPVDDRLTRELMVRFHRSYAKTGNAADALRAAQAGMSSSSDPAIASPRAWASFRISGAQ